MPLVVSVTLENGDTETYRIPEEAFYTSDDYTMIVPGVAERVELDPENMLPDVNPQRGVWTNGEGFQSATPVMQN